jgi:hypothetical protein
VDDVQREEDGIDQTIFIVEKPLPQDDRHHGWDHIGKEDSASDEIPSPKRLIEEQCSDYPHNDLEKGSAKGIDGSKPEADPEFRVVDEIDVIPKAQKFLTRKEGVFLKEAEPDPVNDWIYSKTEDQNQGGCDQQESLGLLVFSQRNFSKENKKAGVGRWIPKHLPFKT